MQNLFQIIDIEPMAPDLTLRYTAAGDAPGIYYEGQTVTLDGIDYSVLGFEFVEDNFMIYLHQDRA
jgi:hypothetical protein